MPACTQTTAPSPSLETTFLAAALGRSVTDTSGGQPALPRLRRNRQTPWPPWGWVRRRPGERYFSTRGKRPATTMLKGCLRCLFFLSRPLPALCTYWWWVKGFLMSVLIGPTTILIPVIILVSVSDLIKRLSSPFKRTSCTKTRSETPVQRERLARPRTGDLIFWKHRSHRNVVQFIC